MHRWQHGRSRQKVNNSTLQSFILFYLPYKRNLAIYSTLLIIFPYNEGVSGLPEILATVNSQLLWPSATTNCGGCRLQISSL